MTFIGTQPSIILGSSASAVSGAADTNENTLATITVPAGAMGLNGILRITTFWTLTNNANSKTLKVYFGGGGGTTYLSVDRASAASFATICTIMNRASASSQVGNSDAAANVFTATTDALTTSSINTAAATTIVITGQKATAGDAITLEAYLVELIRP